MTNYVVTVQGFSGKTITACKTIVEVWVAIRAGSVGSLYSVHSPTGKNVNDFVPF